MNQPFPVRGPEAPAPMFNVPTVILALAAIMIGIEAGRQWLLSADQDFDLLLAFAFWPLRYAGTPLAAELPHGGADVWSFVTYAFLHGGWEHVIFNLAWLVAFGSALARRFDTFSFLAFFVACAVGGAALHLALHADDLRPVVGASAAVSGLTAGALMFIFQRGGPLGGGHRSDPAAYRVPRMTLAELAANRQVRLYFAVWFILNTVFGLWGDALTGGGGIAWEAHVGGFVTGLLAFPLMDPLRRRG
ncbi:rhomboid family intramembrane serine protease [Microvirga tunisiensis]|uniref:Rhomboid family intramembrane serine protease n=2 Tax=Pannonibacter tanglangensis TaxID=2750084 RepID=A0A7X5F1W8_9HYPH|nr:rhomboid family intramembrane serine protease [Pannonibacter sp. XCT-53]